MTLAAYRDGGFWTLLWQAFWSAWTNKRGGSFPPRGFVGLGSSSSQATDLYFCRLKSIRLRRRRYTRAAPRWRLTLEWATSLHPRYRPSGGLFLDSNGESLAVGGAAALRRQTRITLTSRRLISDSHRVQPARDAGAAGLLVRESLGKLNRAVGVRSDRPRTSHE